MVLAKGLNQQSLEGSARGTYAGGRRGRSSVRVYPGSGLDPTRKQGLSSLGAATTARVIRRGGFKHGEKSCFYAETRVVG